jgi:hypothetical protein
VIIGLRSLRTKESYEERFDFHLKRGVCFPPRNLM